MFLLWLGSCGNSLLPGSLKCEIRREYFLRPQWCFIATVLLNTVIILVLHTCISLFGEGNGNPLPYSCLENPVDREAWWAAVHRVAKSRTRLKRLSMHGRTGEGNGNPLQYSCLENPRDRGAWWAAVYGVAQSWTRLKQLSSSSSKKQLFPLRFFLYYSF